MITLKAFVFNSFQENTYVLSDPSGNCVIVDPGMADEDEQKMISDYIRESKLSPEAVINTHCHADHVPGVKFITDTYKVPFYFHQEETELLEHVEEYGAFFGLSVVPPPPPSRYLEDDEAFRFGQSELKLFHVPGHSPGSLAIYSQEDKFVITGDVLFRSSIGRTDLPGGDYATIIRSIQEKLMTLPGDTQVYPGHGPSTTIGTEHDTNPFLT